MHFIVSTNTTRKADSETRKLIRSHVMQGKNKGKPRYDRRRKVTMAKKAARGDLAEKQHPRVSLDTLVETYRDVIPGMVGSSLSFCGFADEMDVNAFEKIIQFSRLSLRIMFPLLVVIDFDQRDSSYFDLLKSDATYYHLTLFAAEAFIDTVLDRQNPQLNNKATRHFVIGVQLLRERLLLGDEEIKISDSTIRVVLLLAIGAYHTGDYVTAKKHMEGLRKIIDLRGGATVFRYKKLLQEIARCDIEIALHSGSDPILFKDPFLEPFIPYPDYKLLPRQKYTDLPYSQNFLDEIDENLATAWRAMRQFSLLTNLAIETQRSIVPQQLVQNTMVSLMYRLIYMRFEIGSANEAIRLGLLSLSYQAFFQWQDMTLPYDFFSSGYGELLVGLESLEGGSPELMLWILVMAAIPSVYTASEGMWLKGSLKERLQARRVKSWGQMRGILKSVLWIDLFDKPGKDIFDWAMSW